MKNIFRIRIVVILLLAMVLGYACNKDFLERPAIGTLNGETLANKSGVNGLLIGAYSLLDGVGVNGTGNAWATGVSNWILGSVAADDSHKGSEFGDEAWIEQIESYKYNPTSAPFGGKWKALYSGIQSANDVIRVLDKVNDGSLTEEESKQIRAEAIFLRAVYHFEAIKIWKNIPFIDESISFGAGNYKVSNAESAWPKIENDFKFAADQLDNTKPQSGRANKWASKCFLVKAYMFQNKLAEAKPILQDIIENGVTASGEKYDLLPRFGDNFDALKENGPESVFSVQMSVNDNSNGNNGNGGDLLNFASGGGPAGCCGFNQPSFSLVNSYKTDAATGLPLLDDWNEEDVKNDFGIPSTDPFVPYTGTLDPRLDRTVGRRGIPYLDWGVMAGASWIYKPEHSGPYIPIKNVYSQADKGNTSEAFGGWAAGQASAVNYTMIRFADVLLWAAEVEIELGSLAKAEEYVNRVRLRAANTDGWVMRYKDDSNPLGGFSNTPAANYKIGFYNGQFTSQGKEYAIKATRFERKLELAMEGHRFFDLQRWDKGSGYMADILNSYIYHETHVPGYNFAYMNDANFIKGKHEIYPIPQSEIDLHVENGASTLLQNPNY